MQHVSLKADNATFIAGALGGLNGAIITQPLDTAKTRIQINGSFYNNSTINCLSHIIKNEGSSSLWKGVSGPCLGRMPIYGIVFYSHEKFMKNKENTIKNHAYSGAFSGLIQSFIATPTELAKCRLQMDMLHSNSKSRHKYGVFSVLSKIYKQNGLPTINNPSVFKGLTCTICRDVLAFAVYFSSYEQIKKVLKFEEPKNIQNVFSYGFLWTMMSGGFAGVLCWGSCYPIDVIKTKIQVGNCSSSQMVMGDKINQSLIIGKTSKDKINFIIRDTYKNGGILTFFRGFSATMVRSFLINSVTFSTVILVKNYLIN